MSSWWHPITSFGKSWDLPRDGVVISKNPIHVSKEPTFKWHVSNFHVSWAINNKATVVKVTLLLHLWKKKNEKNECYALVKHCYFMEENTLQAQKWLEKCYSDSASSRTPIRQWYADFKCSCTDTNDAECLGRPNEAVTPENIKQVLKIIGSFDFDRSILCLRIWFVVNVNSEFPSSPSSSSDEHV